jgi:hypothetical protein
MKVGIKKTKEPTQHRAHLMPKKKRERTQKKTSFPHSTRVPNSSQFFSLRLLLPGRPWVWGLAGRREEARRGATREAARRRAESGGHTLYKEKGGGEKKRQAESSVCDPGFKNHKPVKRGRMRTIGGPPGGGLNPGGGIPPGGNLK